MFTMPWKSSSSHDTPLPSSGEIIRTGVFKKMKTFRKKYFVLRDETPDTLARLEYYKSEKQFRKGFPPKRCIALKTCFNINKKQDSKHKYVIALYTKDDCFCIIYETEEEMKIWLKDLLTLQHGEEIPEGEMPRPKFEYVWPVAMCKRGLAGDLQSLLGNYRLCLIDKTITLVRIGEAIPTVIELHTTQVKSCGCLKNFMFIELGRMSVFGCSEIWVDTYDDNIAISIRDTISHRFNIGRGRHSSPPRVRDRSSSHTETTNKDTTKYNPIDSSKLLLPDTPSSTSETTLTPSEPAPSSTPTVSGVAMSIFNHFLQKGGSKRRHSISGLRDRSDSMPSRPRTTSEGNHHSTWTRPSLTSFRRRDPSHSPPAGSPISPPSDSTGSNYSLPDDHDGHHEFERIYTPLTQKEAIAEEEYPESPKATGNYVPMDQGHASNSASMSSVTSGTPSTDMRLAYYPLEKVIAYVAEDEDTRPFRAYSVGSKPSDAQLSTTPENARVRAFSVGSKTKKYPSRVLPTHHQPTGVKSNSAPILAPNPPRTFSSYGSINNPMDDLMEMDFSVPEKTRSRSSTNGSNGKKSRFMGFLDHFRFGSDKKQSDYVDMKSNDDAYVDMSQGQKFSLDMLANGMTLPGDPQGPYMDMGGNVPLAGHPYSPYLDMSGNNTVGNGNAAYMDMSGGNNAYMDMSGSSPVRAKNDLSEMQRHFGHKYRDYMDMSQRNRTNSNGSRTATSPGSSDISTDYLDMSGGRNRRVNSFGSHMSSSPKQEDGYVDMTPGPGRQQDEQYGDYLNMSGGRSQPIAIQTTSNSSPLSISSLLMGRKLSPPKMHLPLSPYSTLPRQKSPKKTVPSQTSSQSSSITTTPSTSSTMFPMSLNSPSSPTVKVPSAVLNVPYKSALKKKAFNSDDYAMMDFETMKSPREASTLEETPYMNYCPPGPKRPSNNEYSDYAVMKPGFFTLPRMKSSSSGTASPLANHLSAVGLGDRTFKPIREKDERMCSPKAGDVPEKIISTQEPASMEVDESSCDRLKAAKQRPASTTGLEPSRSPSVCSEGLASRLGSNNSVYSSSSSTSTVVGVQEEGEVPQFVRLHYASLDLSADSEDQHSPRQKDESQGLVYADIDFVRSEELSASGKN